MSPSPVSVPPPAHAGEKSLSVEDAIDRITRAVVPLAEMETVGLEEALGRILAKDVISPEDVPAHDNSAMDGYALCASDLGQGGWARLEEIGTALAGRPFTGTVGRGTCVRIMTGAFMPDGADTVVPQEFVAREANRILVPAGQKVGANRRLRGEDLQKGSAALTRGSRIMAAELGILASLGIRTVEVTRRVRVAMFSTGDELRSLGEPLDAGAVYDSNRYTLYGMLKRLDVEIIDLGVVGDDPASIGAALREAASAADAIITTGGISEGEADFTRSLLEDLAEVVFWKIAMKPGKPMCFGHLGEEGKRALLFGLPGNPVAVMVSFYALVRDALLRLAGARPEPLPQLTLRADSALRKSPGRTEYLRAIAYPGADGWRVRVTGSQGSGILRSMSEANCLIVLPHERGAVAAGELVCALPLYGLV